MNPTDPNSTPPAAASFHTKADPWRVYNRPASGDAFGLCALTSSVYSERDIGDAVLSVEVGGRRGTVPAAEVGRELRPRHWSFLFHVNTHLLDNGPQTFFMSLAWPDGGRGELGELAVNVVNTGELAQSVRRDLLAGGTPLVFGQVVDSRLFPYSGGQARAWFDEPAREDIPLSAEPARDAEAARRHLARWGFAVLYEAAPEDVIRSFNREVDEAIGDGRLAHQAGSSERIHDAHHLPSGRRIWLYPPVLSFLREWFRDEPCACQSLLYINGSEQSPHQDTIHLTPYPAGFMCGVWVALEDIRSGSGELVVYPGSHRAPRLYAATLGLEKVSDDYSSYAKFDAEIARIIEREGFERLVYSPKAGQILVWHENLIHGGSRRLDPALTRRSIVSHYFARGGIAYYDSRGEAAALEAIV